MKKNDIKNSLKELTPDPYLQTRLEAKVKSFEPAPKKPRKLVASTIAMCALVIALGIVAGSTILKTDKKPTETTSGVIETHQAQVNTENVKESVKENDVLFVSHPAEFYNYTEEINTLGITLTVKGENITEGNYIKFQPEKNYVDLPFEPIIEKLGGKFTWYNNSTCTLEINDTMYILSVEHANMHIKGDDNYIDFRSDKYVKTEHRKINGEYIIDNVSLGIILENFGYSIAVDFDNKTIDIK